MPLAFIMTVMIPEGSLILIPVYRLKPPALYIMRWKMTDKKKPKKDVRSDKNKPESADDLSEFMATDDDWEILEMTERTLTGPTGEKEETIFLSEVEKKLNDEADTDDLTKAAGLTGKADDGVREQEISETEADEDILDLTEPDENLQVRETEEEETPDTATVEDEQEDQGADEEEQKEEEEEEESKTARRKLLKTMILILLPVSVAVIFTIIFFIRKSAYEPEGAVSGNAEQPVALPVSKPAPSAKAIPIQTIKLETPSQPQVLAKPADKKEPGVASATQEGKTVKTAENDKKTMPVPPLQETPVPAAKVNENALHILRDVNLKETGGELQMKILTDRPAGEYKCFALSNPSRLVVDLLGSWDKPPFQEKKTNTGRISRIRVGQHEGRLRIVADMSGNQAFTPVITTSPDGLTVSLPLN